MRGGEGVEGVEGVEVVDGVLTSANHLLLLATHELGKGSRCEADNNAFWSAAAALLPADLIEKRQARAAGRILELNYQQVASCSIPS